MKVENHRPRQDLCSLLLMTPFTKKYKFFVCSGFLVPGPSPAWDARMARSLVSSHGVVQTKTKKAEADG